MGRYDAQRSAATPHELPDTLHLQWVREYPPQIPAWPDQDKMQFDLAFEPVVAGRTLFFNSSRHDCVRALDVASGREKWRFFTGGPVRFAPLVWEDRVYFTSDDGCLYCVAAADGKPCWKFRGGPSDRKILGNERLISTWPARGAPVLVDGTVYCGASIWPFMGIFIHAVDARTGRTVWTNDGDGSLYMKQPHNADSFASVAPQGPLVAIGDTLLIPGGRSVPACFDRRTGKFLRYQLAANGKRGGGSEVAAVGDVFFNGGAAFELATEKYLGEVGKQVALTPDVVYAYSAGACRAFDLQGAKAHDVESVDKRGKSRTTTRWAMDEIASCKTPVAETLIKAGRRLYLGTTGKVQAIDVDLDEGTMTLGWSADVDGKVLRLVAAADRLFAVTREGRIYCFGAEGRTGRVTEPTSAGGDKRALNGVSARPRSVVERASALLAATNQREGYCVVWGAGDGGLLAELARQSKLHIIAVEPDARNVQAVRDRLTDADLYGTRIAVVHADPASVSLPPYLASLMVCEDPGSLPNDPPFAARLHEALRPYGGVACFLDNDRRDTVVDRLREAKLANATLTARDGFTVLTRAGALPGSANWTHEHADAANTRVSKDQLVKAPLGILWFGGPSHDGILPRHGHGPQPQVIDGRMIIEGVDLIRALDIYTGRLLWETKIPGVGRFFNNLSHQPGANASGSNFVCTSDTIYVVHEKKCLRLDPATGKIIGEFRLPILPGMHETPRWGHVSVAGDYLIGGADPLFDPKALPPPITDPRAGDDKEPGAAPVRSSSLSKVLKLIKGPRDNLSASRHIVVLNRHTGTLLWSRAANYAFRHNAICVGGGRLYVVDRLSGDQLADFKKKDEEPPHPYRLLALDLKTGDGVWKAADEVFGTWLSYSAKHDVVIEAGRVARDTLRDEPRGMRAYRAGDGQVLWYDKAYTGPAMIHGDTILQGQGACDLLTGAVKKRVDPITGELVPWTWTRNYGCNTPAASEHLLTFRSGAAGYFDLCNDGGTGNFGGFRSSCTNNLIVAGGLLTVPEYTRTCTCAYQNQTSVAMVHMPEAEMWTFFGTRDLKGQVRRLGLAFGAPGDRKAGDGTLWLEYPFVGGASPAVRVTTVPEQPELFRRHSSQVSGPWNWVAASGVRGVEEISIQLDKEPGPRTFTVRLVFAEPEPIEPGGRVFNVEVQGREALTNLDIVKEAGGPLRSLVKEVTGVEVEDVLMVRLTPSARATNRTTILCGIEVIAEEQGGR
ncbi:MAG: PQQ-binding-like beta-propeller repeat protein [Gemmataceae bacterium]|nr:PQQ-binding-like beta-propeller repeat protein [Gemmataceae bacterium]